MMSFQLCPSGLSEKLISAFAFNGSVSAPTDQAGVKSLSGLGTLTKVPGAIGSSVRLVSGGGLYTTADADLIGNPAATWTRVSLLKTNSDYSLTTSRSFSLYRSISTNNDRLLISRNTAVDASDPYIYLEAGDTPSVTTFDAAELDDWIILISWTNGTTSTSMELRRWSDFSVIASNTVANIQTSDTSLRFLEPQTSCSFDADNLLFFDEALSESERESLWLLWKPQYDYLRGFRAGRASCLSS